MFIASKKYKIVCKDTCYHVRNIKFKNLITYKTLEEACADNCRPCKHCLKDQVWF